MMNFFGKKKKQQDAIEQADQSKLKLSKTSSNGG